MASTKFHRTMINATVGDLFNYYKEEFDLSLDQEEIVDRLHAARTQECPILVVHRADGGLTAFAISPVSESTVDETAAAKNLLNGLQAQQHPLHIKTRLLISHRTHVSLDDALVARIGSLSFDVMTFLHEHCGDMTQMSNSEYAVLWSHIEAMREDFANLTYVAIKRGKDTDETWVYIDLDPNVPQHLS